MRRAPYPRSSWTSSAPGGVPITRSLNESWQHHTAGPQPAGGVKATKAVERALIRSTRDYHISFRAMSDIAYSWATMPSGRSYELRGRRTGGHTYNHNSISFGIVVFGNYDVQEPPPEMMQGLRDLYDWLEEQRLLIGGPHPTGGHRDVGAEGGGTACPGGKLYARLAEIRREPSHAKHHHAHTAGEHLGDPEHHHRHGDHPHAMGGTPATPHHHHPHRHGKKGKTRHVHKGGR